MSLSTLSNSYFYDKSYKGISHQMHYHMRQNVQTYINVGNPCESSWEVQDTLSKRE